MIRAMSSEVQAGGDGEAHVDEETHLEATAIVWLRADKAVPTHLYLSSYRSA